MRFSGEQDVDLMSESELRQYAKQLQRVMAANAGSGGSSRRKPTAAISPTGDGRTPCGSGGSPGRTVCAGVAAASLLPLPDFGADAESDSGVGSTARTCSGFSSICGSEACAARSPCDSAATSACSTLHGAPPLARRGYGAVDVGTHDGFSALSRQLYTIAEGEAAEVN